MIPLIHDMKEKRITIFGGGEVALRKAAFFTPEADVTVVGRSIREEIAALGVECIEEFIIPGSEETLSRIGNSFLVVAATSDRDLNNAIGYACRDRGILFNNADGEAGDVIVPSVAWGKHFMIAVSTGGKSPVVPWYIRQKIESSGEAIDGMIEIQSEIREDLKLSISDQKERSRVLREIVCDEEVWRHLENGKNDAVEYIKGRYLR